MKGILCKMFKSLENSSTPHSVVILNVLPCFFCSTTMRSLPEANSFLNNFITDLMETKPDIGFKQCQGYTNKAGYYMFVCFPHISRSYLLLFCYEMFVYSNIHVSRDYYIVIPSLKYKALSRSSESKLSFWSTRERNYEFPLRDNCFLSRILSVQA